VGCQTNDILHDEHRWTEVIDITCKFLKESVAWIIFIRGAERPDRRKALTWRPADYDIDFTLQQTCPLRDIPQSDFTDVSCNRDCPDMVQTKGVDGHWENIDSIVDPEGSSVLKPL